MSSLMYMSLDNSPFVGYLLFVYWIQKQDGFLIHFWSSKQPQYIWKSSIVKMVQNVIKRILNNLAPIICFLMSHFWSFGERGGGWLGVTPQYFLTLSRYKLSKQLLMSSFYGIFSLFYWINVEIIFCSKLSIFRGSNPSRIVTYIAMIYPNFFVPNLVGSFLKIESKLVHSRMDQETKFLIQKRKMKLRKKLLQSYM